jgi:PqqD family protein of HPr-rel-A system
LAIDAPGHPSQLDVLWQAAPAEQWLAASWGALAAIHHRPSGKTHFVNRSTVVLLTTVLGRALTGSQAVRELARAMGVDATPQYVHEVAGVLARLDEIGLITRGRCPGQR